MKEASDAAKVAYDKVTGEIKKIIDAAAALVSDRCKQLSSVDALNTINQAMNDLRAEQRAGAPKLASLPDEYIEAMQSHQRAIDAVNVKI